MLTVLIDAGEDAEALARTLAGLVGGAVEGIVREVMVNAAGSGADALEVAEHAGCVVLRGELASGVARAKGDWLLLLEPGARLGDGWTDAARAHAETATEPACFSPSGAERAPSFRRLFRRSRPLEFGLLMTKRQAAAQAANAGTVASIAQGLRPRRMAAEIRPAR